MVSVMYHFHIEVFPVHLLCFITLSSFTCSVAVIWHVKSHWFTCLFIFASWGLIVILHPWYPEHLYGSNSIKGIIVYSRVVAPLFFFRMLHLCLSYPERYLWIRSPVFSSHYNLCSAFIVSVNMLFVELTGFSFSLSGSFSIS